MLARPPSLFAPALALLGLALAACGGSPAKGHEDDWYYHFACNGDSQCLATNPLGTQWGTIDEGPVEVNCTQLQQFRLHFWGPASWDACDHNPSFTPPGYGTPTIATLSPTSGIPGTTVTITGTDFPTLVGDLSVELPGGKTITSTTVNASLSVSGNTTIVFTVPLYTPAVRGPITVHTPGGQASSSVPFTVLDDLTGVAWSGTSFVAVGDYGTALTSADGVSWTPQTTGLDPTTVSLSSVSWAGGKFLAGGSNRTIASSPDGVGWSVVDSEGGTKAFTGIATSGSRYVAVGAGGVLSTSPDGASWSAASFGLPTDDYRGVVWGNGRFVAAGRNVVTSSDASSWAVALTSTVQHNAIAWSGSRFVVVGAGGSVATSTDGASWTPQSAGTTAELRGVAWYNGLFVAVGANGALLTSPDGGAWTARANGASASLNAVAASSTSVVAVGDRGVTISSSDGLDWSSNLLPAPTGVGVAATRSTNPVVSWNAVPGATGYVVYAGGPTVSKTSYIFRWPASGTSLVTSGMPINGTPGYWYFIVTAVDAYGEGAASVPTYHCVGAGICG